MKEIIFRDSLSFLKEGVADKTVFKSDDVSITYKELWRLVDDKSAQLTCCKGKYVGVYSESFIERITTILSIIQVGGYAFVIDLNRWKDTNFLVSESLDSECFVTIERKHAAHFSGYKTIIQLSNNEGFVVPELNGLLLENSTGGLVLQGNKNNSEVYKIDISLVEAHVKATIRHFNITESSHLLTGELIASNDLLECILPSIAVGSTVTFLSNTSVIIDEKNEEGILKIDKTALKKEVLERLIEKSPVAITKLIVSAGSKLTGFDLKNALALIPALQEVQYTYQTTQIPLSIIQGGLKTTDINVNSIDSLPYTLPFGGIFISILNANSQNVPINVTGRLVYESKLLSNFIGENDNTEKLFVGGKERIVRSMEYAAKFLASGEILLVNRRDREISKNKKTIALDLIEDPLTMHKTVAEVAVVRKETKVIAYLKMKEGFQQEKLPNFRKWLKRHIALDSIPDAFIKISKLPKKKDQTIDYKVLEALEIKEESTEALTELQTNLISLWKRVLNRETVTLEDNFFELGGHSLLATKLVSFIGKELGLQLTIKDVFLRPICGDMVMFLESASDEERIPIVALNNPEGTKIPLSFAQEGLWFIDQFQGSVQYHVPALLKIKGAVNRSFLEIAFREILNRHQPLRTVIRQEEGMAYQVVKSFDWELNYFESVESNDADLLIKETIKKPFDLSNDCVLRALLIKEADNAYTLVLTLHHIAADGWSAFLLLEELKELYEAQLSGNTPNLSPIDIQYTDYSIWQKNTISGTYLEKELAYWKQQLKGVEYLDLQTDYPRALQQGTNGARKTFTISANLRAQLNTISQQEGATLFMTVLAAFNILLYKYTNQKDVCVGSPIAGRHHQEIEPLVGFFANTLALRTDISLSETFSELILQVKKVTLDAYLHQDVPFEKIVDALGIERSMSHSPIFQVMFSMETVPDLLEIKMGDLMLKNTPLEQMTTQFDWNFYMEDNGDSGMEFHIEYDTDLFKGETIDQLGAYYIHLLKTVAQDPDCSIASLSLLTKEETSLLISRLNNTKEEFPFYQTCDQIIDSMAETFPDTIAISDRNGSITYKNLCYNAGKLAGLLKDKIQIEKEAIVGVMADRSVTMIESIYAIWKSGAAYVPIHPELPENRIEIIVKDAGVKTLVYTKNHSALALKLLESVTSLKTIICLDGNSYEYLEPSVLGDSYGIQHINAQEPLLQSNSVINGLAYVLYTSGSTGKPKGAMIEHKGMLNHLFIMLKDLSITKESVVAQNASQSFDISVWQMFVALVVGAKTVVYSKWETLDIQQFITQLNTDKISIFQLVPSYLSLLLDAIKDSKQELFTPLKYLLVTGETVKKSLLNRWFEKFSNIKVVNAYGPTEASDDVTLHIMDKTPEMATIPIGKPLANLNIYITNSDEQLCPIGVKGEIWVSGIGVGRGYINDAVKTKTVFINDPFVERKTRLYKTGDIGRFLADGTIEFYGRNDYQVKVRGYRIELEEIEQYLSQLKQVKEAIVLVIEKEEQGAQIFGFITAYNNIENIEILRQELSVFLPEYMLPSQIFVLENFPLTLNGKIDRKLLSQFDMDTVTETSDTEVAKNPIEIGLIEIWKNLLELPEIDINQSFFKLGGHSLKVVSMISLVRKNLGAEIAIKDVFIYPTVKLLSKIIKDASKVEFEPISFTQIAEYYPVSNAQRRLWILDCFMDDSSAYNAYNAFKMIGEVNVKAFSEAIMSIVKRHEVLRTTFIEREGVPMQLINNSVKLSDICTIVDYSGKGVTFEAVKEELSSVANAPYNLSKGPLFRSRIYILDNNSYVFFCCMHHIICDGWSNTIIVKEILENYRVFQKQQMSKLAVLGIQYKDYAAWHLQKMKSEAYEVHKKYWHSKLAGEIPILNIPSYLNRPSVQGFSGKTITHIFKKETLDGLKALSTKEEASLFMVLTSLLNILFNKYTAQKDIIIGTVTAGRTHSDLENQVGYYLNTLALRNTIDPELTFMQTLAQIKETTLEAFNHQDYPFDQLVNELDFERDISRNPIFDVMILLQNFDEDEDELLIKGLSDLDISVMTIDNLGSPFDMDFDFTEQRDELLLLLTYNDAIYTSIQMETIILHFEILISKIVNNPSKKTKDISIISAAEERMLNEMNATYREYPLHLTYHHYLEKYALETPERTAAIFKEKTVTYKVLNENVNQVANALLKQITLQPDDLVAILLERSDTMMSTILAVWKTGAAYIPIEKKTPDNRILSIIDDAGVKLLITDKNLVSEALKSKVSGFCKLIFIQDLFELAIAESLQNLNVTINPDTLSFVIFTSGSTGTPKGAMNEHIGMMNHALATVDYLEMDFNAVLVQNASQSFDISVWQMFTALITGGTTAIYGDEIVNAPDQLLKNLIKHKATVFQVVPSYLSMLLEIIDGDTSDYALQIRHLICCGEAIKPKAMGEWLSLFPSTKLVNDYGPAEASDGTTWNVFDTVDITATTIPVGTPIYNMSNYIVDDYMNLCPIGVTGEICVGGIGVGRGYINDEIRTKKVFLKDPFSKVEQRLYKTGDLGRVLPNGMIEFKGRKDYQIKVNGQRIELGEIEAKLIQLNAVKDAVVIDKVNPVNERVFLFAFVVAEPTIDSDIFSIKNELGKELPSFMVPSELQFMDVLPLTPNGKVDRNYLSKLVFKENEHVYIAPETEIEYLLVDAWKQILKIENVGITDNFYESGGDSIGAIQVSSYLYKNQLQVEVKDIMSFATIKELAPLVTSLKRIAEQGPITGDVKLTPIQDAFFKFDKAEANHYTQSIVLKSRNRVEYQLLLETLQYLQKWHDALRTTFKNDYEKVVQQYINGIDFPVVLQEYNFENEVGFKNIENVINELHAGISLKEGPLLQSALLKMSDADYVFISIHHLVIDVVSWRVIVEDLATIYSQLKANEMVNLPAKTDSFKVWSETLNTFAMSEVFNTEIDYWNSQCTGDIERIPYDFQTNKKAIVKNVQIESIQLDKKYSTLLDTGVHKAFHTEINDILLAALAMSMHNCFTLTNVAIMLESHGRTKLNDIINTNRTVGWFTSEYPVILENNTKGDLVALIKKVKEHLHRVPNNGIGYGILKQQAKERVVTNFKTPQLAFNYLGKVDDAEEDGLFLVQEQTLGLEESLINKSDYPLEFLGLSKNGCLKFTLNYHTSQFKKETIVQWLKSYIENLKTLIIFCSERDFSESTPSDFDYSELSVEDLEDLNTLF